VDKDRFLIGRSKTQADLRVDDPNVSRQHAQIERVGSGWFLVDLGSTNGVHIGGERIARRALADGDVILVISHQIHCSVR
jgi:pSer/pThr/pTyr-binding forkhead associated (FHA) protein